MDLRRRLTDLCNAFNAHDLDLLMTYFAEDCVLEMPRGGEPWGSRFEGMERVRAALATRFRGLPTSPTTTPNTSSMSNPQPAYRNGPSPEPRRAE